MSMTLPLENLLVIDFSQFLSAPSATLRLADLGAEVIKIEKPVTGDICRTLYASDVAFEGQSSLFHAINRNKKSLVLNLKDESDIANAKKLIRMADVVVHNFRPGVMKRLGLDYETILAINPSVIYAEINGYGEEGFWKDEPGQDLLLQGVSGLSWLSGEAGEPVPMGASVVDMLAGTYLTQGILAALFQKGQSGEGSLVQVSMLESSMEFQFELFTTFLNDGNELPKRSAVNAANAFLAAPYGLYQTTDGYIALAMGSITQIGELLGCAALQNYPAPADWFNKRDEIKSMLQAHLLTQSNENWLSILEAADIWCAPVFDYAMLRSHEGYTVLDMEQETTTGAGTNIITTRCPIKINEQIFTSPLGAPALGEHSASLRQRFGLSAAATGEQIAKHFDDENN